MNMATFFDQTKLYSTQKKRLFQMAYFKFHERNYWESLKLTNSQIIPSMENQAHYISCKPPHKNHPREYFGTTLWFIQITTSVVEKSQILSVTFHLSPTVITFTFWYIVRWNISIYNFERSSWRSSTLNEGLGWRDKIHGIKQQTHPTFSDIIISLHSL